MGAFWGEEPAHNVHTTSRLRDVDDLCDWVASFDILTRERWAVVSKARCYVATLGSFQRVPERHFVLGDGLDRPDDAMMMRWNEIEMG